MQQTRCSAATLPDNRRHEEVPGSVDGARQVTPLCPNLVCSVVVLDGTEVHEDVPRLGHPTKPQQRCLAKTAGCRKGRSQGQRWLL